MPLRTPARSPALSKPSVALHLSARQVSRLKLPTVQLAFQPGLDRGELLMPRTCRGPDGNPPSGLSSRHADRIVSPLGITPHQTLPAESATITQNIGNILFGPLADIPSIPVIVAAFQIHGNRVFRIDSIYSAGANLLIRHQEPPCNGLSLLIILLINLASPPSSAVAATERCRQG